MVEIDWHVYDCYTIVADRDEALTCTALTFLEAASHTYKHTAMQPITSTQPQCQPPTVIARCCCDVSEAKKEVFSTAKAQKLVNRWQLLLAADLIIIALMSTLGLTVLDKV